MEVKEKKRKRNLMIYSAIFGILLIVIILIGRQTEFVTVGEDKSYNQQPQKSIELKEKALDDTQIKEETQLASETSNTHLFQEDGKTLHERFDTPEGYVHLSPPEDSFAYYLQNLPLKPHGEEVHYYDGRVKANRSVYEAVIDMDIGSRDLQQCADAVMRLRGEYLFYGQKKDQIHFNLTNGFRVDFLNWIEGNRVKVEGNTTTWVKKTEVSESYETFRDYMTFVFIYAGTLSLEQELESVDIETMAIGDVFIVGGSPGHAVIVVDMAIDASSGKKLYMLAQSYMPAQDIQILSSPDLPQFSPWYELTEGEVIRTPEWTFSKNDLKRFTELD